ncbi:hydroxyethylthiazole kinase-like uncharacterized protein yjeF [Bifidobacterium commune]|uniref:Multifunctional fusion protein n=1 Tax=Bifidobacterium commune TaxID=1505727 RepID=A0A1C4H245_9BIFI|nr:bifunctional ADP-dependent NAD(P)H-hydrate dehydratase/NAD(P)H-hydrate epimerase [Bifidobacterium commune]MBB2954852.1 hydroxyethylthiazole kinase-like uncharacterized protein yjeF [Bifidobacterium commune]SCC78915.1 yjeF N-terminal region [Bifidobacterium commune]
MDEMMMTKQMRRSALQRNAYDVETVRAMERPLLNRGVPLMRMAASAAAQVTDELLDEHDIDVADANIVLLAGAGDNGGDGLYAAAQLARAGAQVTTIAVGESLHIQGLLAFTHSGGRLLVLNPEASIPGVSNGFGAGEAGERLQAAMELVQHADVVLDAMTGIGVHGPLQGPAATMAQMLHPAGESAKGSHTTPCTNGEKPFVVAIDTPSGIGVNDGTLPGSYIPADVTVMFGAMKPCAMLPPATFTCGRVVLIDFGFDITHIVPAVSSIDNKAGTMLRRPKPTDSKYSRGVVGLITGSVKYPGAAVLSSTAANHCNIGMVRYLGPANAADMVLRNAPEIVTGKGRVQAWAVGSGVPTADALYVIEDHTSGRHSTHTPDAQREAIAALLNHYALSDENTGESVGNAGIAPNRRGSDLDCSNGPWAMPPICVDAGALDLLPKRVPQHVVITPHAGELAALLRLHGEQVDTSAVTAEPWRWAKRAHELTGATVLLKGAVTIIVGDSEMAGMAPQENDDETEHHIVAHKATTTYISGSGPAWLATAGAGDVLAGIMAAMLAQQNEGQIQQHPSLSATTAASASYIHGYAAGLASQSNEQGWEPPEIFGAKGIRQSGENPGHPIVAGDVVAALPQAIENLLGNSHELTR